jgi:hypothetical protein
MRVRAPLHCSLGENAMRRLIVFAALVGVSGLAAEAFAQGPGGRSGGGCGAGGSAMARRAGNMQSALARRAILESAGGGNSGSSGHVKPDPEQKQRAVLKIYDVDYDGTLNDAEQAKLIDAMKVRGYSNAYIGRFFANILGISLPAAGPERNQTATSKPSSNQARAATKLQGEMLAKYDANADGKLSGAEKMAMRQAIATESKPAIE